MSARCSEPLLPTRRRAARRAAAPAAAGFTLVELICVLVLLGTLAVVAMPRMEGAIGLRSSAWRDQVQAALRQAASLAQGHRRLVCASINSTDITLRIASSNPATACDTALKGQDGDNRWAWQSDAPATSGSPATLYFQPSGRVSSDGAGNSTSNATISISGESAITVNGETGHVQ